VFARLANGFVVVGIDKEAVIAKILSTFLMSIATLGEDLADETA
jgi:hypothetical protein